MNNRFIATTIIVVTLLVACASGNPDDSQTPDTVGLQPSGALAENIVEDDIQRFDKNNSSFINQEGEILSELYHSLNDGENLLIYASAIFEDSIVDGLQRWKLAKFGNPDNVSANAHLSDSYLRGIAHDLDHEGLIKISRHGAAHYLDEISERLENHSEVKISRNEDRLIIQYPYFLIIGVKQNSLYRGASFFDVQNYMCDGKKVNFEVIISPTHPLTNSIAKSKKDMAQVNACAKLMNKRVEIMKFNIGMINTQKAMNPTDDKQLPLRHVFTKGYFKQ